jgi:hypothetical protein
MHDTCLCHCILNINFLCTIQKLCDVLVLDFIHSFSFLTYLLTHSMVHDIRWKAYSHSACQTACFLYGLRRFVTVLTKAHHWTLSWASWIQFTLSP